jgi:hypothetical protein
VVVASQNVVIDDISNPYTPTLADLTDECSVTATAPTTSDNCGTVTGTTSDPLTYTIQGILPTINWTPVDGNGNVVVASQNVVIDISYPYYANIIYCYWSM